MVCDANDVLHRGSRLAEQGLFVEADCPQRMVKILDVLSRLHRAALERGRESERERERERPGGALLRGPRGLLVVLTPKESKERDQLVKWGRFPPRVAPEHYTRPREQKAYGSSSGLLLHPCLPCVLHPPGTRILFRRNGQSITA